MLWTPGNSFNWSVDNFSGFTDSTVGTSVPGNASANLKGANTAILAGLAEDCYGLTICFGGGNTSAAARRQLTDILIDPAAGVGNAGTSWSVLINNLASNSPCYGANSNNGYWYYFPIFLKAGTAIGAAHQDSAASSAALSVAVRAYGKPTRPELVRVGTRVQTLGADTITTSGATITPGSSAQGSYTTSLGTLNFDAFWWQAGLLSDDTTMTARPYVFDVAVNATNKIIVAQDIPYHVGGGAEQASKGAMGSCLPVNEIAAGQDVYARAAALGGPPDSAMSVVVYAVGG